MRFLFSNKISPFSVASAIPDNKIKQLATTIKKVLKNAMIKIQKNYPDLTHGEIRDFPNIHTRKNRKPFFYSSFQTSSSDERHGSE